MIEGFEDFTPDNDPHSEHDAGFLYRDVIGQWHTRWTADSTRPALSVMWKCDPWSQSARRCDFAQVEERKLTACLILSGPFLTTDLVHIGFPGDNSDQRR